MNINHLLNVFDLSFEIGFSYHITQTGRLPDRFALGSVDEEKWEEFLAYIKQTYSCEEERCMYNEEHRSDGSITNTYLMYLQAAVTVFKKPQSAYLYFDETTNNRIKSCIKEEFFKIEQKKNPSQNIGIIISRGGGLDVKTFDYSLPKYSVIEYLNPKTKQFHQQMREKLESTDGSGLYLMYGKPGTGKTSFIKNVLSQTDKQALFISPYFTESLTSPSLISLLMNYPDSILVIEDAETVLMERKADNSSAVSNLLNLTDGFLADFLNLKIICTFNTDLENIDEALLREGRLKAMHEFTEIQPERAKKIAAQLGRDITPTSPMTLAEICAEKGATHDFTPSKIGFSDFPIDKPFN